MVDTQTTDILLERLRARAPDILWDMHRDTMEADLIPCIDASLTGESERMQSAILDAHAEALVTDATGSGHWPVGQILKRYGVHLTLVAWDRWIRRTAKQVAVDGVDRAPFITKAETLDAELSAFDDALHATEPAIHAQFSDRLSEMYLDLEFLMSGTPGSLRLSALINA